MTRRLILTAVCAAAAASLACVPVPAAWCHSFWRLTAGAQQAYLHIVWALPLGRNTRRALWITVGAHSRHSCIAFAFLSWHA